MPELQAATIDEISAAALHDILRLRGDVFVVEQDCAYPDIDGRDAEPTTVQLWLTERGEVVATLRLLVEPGGGTRIGRVATRVEHRGRGWAATLMEAALARAARPVVLGAQAHLADWYARFGFALDGEPYDEDGIAHVPMRLG